jgi:hypothetical protein
MERNSGEGLCEGETTRRGGEPPPAARLRAGLQESRASSPKYPPSVRKERMNSGVSLLNPVKTSSGSNPGRGETLSMLTAPLLCLRPRRSASMRALTVLSRLPLRARVVLSTVLARGRGLLSPVQDPIPNPLELLCTAMPPGVTAPVRLVGRVLVWKDLEERFNSAEITPWTGVLARVIAGDKALRRRPLLRARTGVGTGDNPLIPCLR